MPNISARPSEIAFQCPLTSEPGWSTSSPYWSAACEEIERVERELREDEQRHDRRPAEQQHRLHDLHPGRRDHPAEHEQESITPPTIATEAAYGSPKIRLISVPAPTICAMR